MMALRFILSAILFAVVLAEQSCEGTQGSSAALLQTAANRTEAEKTIQEHTESQAMM